LQHCYHWKAQKLEKKESSGNLPWIPVFEAASQFNKTVIPSEPASLPRTRYGVGRDPWFDRLTTLSEVEGESRKIAENKIILDPGSHPAPRDLAGMTNCDTASRGGGK
jgi:hypothetical protein